MSGRFAPYRCVLRGCPSARQALRSETFCSPKRRRTFWSVLRRRWGLTRVWAGGLFQYLRMSSAWSATSRFSRAFSFSNALSCLATSGAIPPYLCPHR